MKTQKVRQTITLDLERLDQTFKWVLDLERRLKLLMKLDNIDDLDHENVVKLIDASRLELSSIDTTLIEFQEIYKALIDEAQIKNSSGLSTPPSIEGQVPNHKEELVDLEDAANRRFIKNLQNSLDRRD